jgi:hypothetical protein
MKLDELEQQARAARERLQQTRAELKQLRRSSGDLIRQQRTHAIAVARLNGKRKARVAGMLFELFEKEGLVAEAHRLGFDDVQLPLLIEQAFAHRRGLREAFVGVMERIAAALAQSASSHGSVAAPKEISAELAAGEPARQTGARTARGSSRKSDGAPTAVYGAARSDIVPDHLLMFSGDKHG